MTNGGGQKHRKEEEKKADRKEPKAVAGKASGPVTRPVSGK